MLKGKIAVVTGGSRGIGRAVCLKLAENGADVAFLYAGNEEKALATQQELLALDSKESFQDNRQFYRQRLEAEDMPAIRGLLVQDRQHLDSVQTTMASSREFCFVLRRRKTDGTMNYAPLEQQFRDCGFTVQRAEGQRLLELLAIYFEQDATHEVFSFVDGAQWLTAETEV